MGPLEGRRSERLDADTGSPAVDYSREVDDFCELVDCMRQGMSAVREAVKAIKEKYVYYIDIDTKDGISLLSLKHHLMLSYLQSLVLVCSRRAAGHALTERSPPSQSFSAPDRPARGPGAGDRVDSMIEARVVLEKVKVLEGRMKYQIDKLVRVAEEAPSASQNVVNDPLAFKPNPQALMDQGSGSEDEEREEEDTRGRDGIYRPPKLAPMPYTEPRRNKDKSRRVPVPTALSTLARLDPTKPFVESTSGLGSTPGIVSGRARELQRITEFEEENMTRLIMKKRDAKRRKQDEADIALGGTAAASGRRGRGGGFEDEFGDILRSVGRSRGGVVGDGYEELRQRGKKESVLARSRARGAEDAFEDLGDDGPKPRKRSRFARDVKAAKRHSTNRR
ncbi:uncharacterized protein LAESUDRAFT_664706 [Laetiporus sulphureus 93-53]|uniref:Uncharacterized protein n=1 Tax=Laetiporus sulphureus 93-53 TaxID=1314785 RepID=A0A165BHH8_9APHY|nr:uncharacterized protein LAESUDRAFT_664706 [Laetiporus sulphureus 93-53]KZT01065.1 hypothetical protein LAESUDRAFT_664706 [Laetiporus sulphureus 93-53]